MEAVAKQNDVTEDNNEQQMSSGDREMTHVLVELKPFVNQVGGHTCVLEIDARTICKPYVQREVWFYENVPDSMREFTPQYYGNIDVRYDVSKGSRRLIACIPTQSIAEHSLQLRYKDTSNDVMTSHCSKRGRKRSYDFLERAFEPSEGCDSTNDNQWSMKCLERQITRYGFWANNRPQKFIMLGNLVSDYKYPCMMDIKMGRRQYGDDSSEEKRKLLESRCAKSTSSTLGFRICGTQVYQCSSESYTIHDKYYGRYLDHDGVCNELRFFFNNGIMQRNDVITLIIRKLEKLHNILQTEKRLNLYSCSLLLIYDGYVPCDKPDAEVTHNLAENKNCHDQNRSKTCQLNLETAIAMPQNKVSDTYSSHICHANCTNMPAYSEECSEDTGANHDMDCSTDAKFDVRLIDFAHVSEKNDEQYNSDEEESSIIFGLTKLADTLREMLRNT